MKKGNHISTFVQEGANLNVNVRGEVLSHSTSQLIEILSNENIMTSTSTRKRHICIRPKSEHQQKSQLNVQRDIQLQEAPCVTDTFLEVTRKSSLGPAKQKIPRPANAFMLFANVWRKKLAVENPRESNKDISVRLGILWKNMAKDVKEEYFTLAREVDAEHKRKYPDYVYNPKEARLRKAMREQSREMSRQSILQSAVASAVRTASPLNVNTSKNMNFSHHPSAGSTSVLGAGATISTLPENSSNDNYDRAVNPWISLGHAAPIGLMKPILLSRGIPAHQGMADKSNEMLRIEVDCVNGHAFSNSSTSSYAGDFVQHNTNADTVSGQPSSDYCIIAEFTEGQKWHPYQNVPNSYHGGGTPISKIATLHGNIPNAASHTHGAWTQFCGLPLPTSTTQSAMLRSPRHMLFLQDHRSEQRNFIDEAHHNSNKVEIHDEEKCTENDGRWMHGTSNELSSSSTLQPGRRLHTDLSSEQQDDQMHLQVRMQSRTYSQKPFMQTYTECNSYQANQLKSDEWSKENFCCKQRLPGFHQAFGSTEIGRFSRSQFFTSMVGSDSDNSGSRDGFLSTTAFPFPSNSQCFLAPNTAVQSATSGDDDFLQIIPDDCYWLSTGRLLSPTDVTPNFAAFLDYSHRYNQEWLDPSSTISSSSISRSKSITNTQYPLSTFTEHSNYLFPASHCNFSDNKMKMHPGNRNNLLDHRSNIINENDSRSAKNNNKRSD
ncbi:uncharacterized protein LOC107272205 isoform X2 [Cephus cinctus]|uniref:Sex-determining region Y protein n=1 Tax=Cephus cinctus TaxID=211228 RepID=A0AAJ7RQK7_CEPCN|nr:uncharacterized protein LOC107272205 isoform X2 [Cephus cinctus]